jgi:small subunit ribosomal protein S1
LTNDPEAHAEGGNADAHTDMATLLEEGLDYRSPHRGEIVEGTVMDWDRDGMLVDIGAKSEGIVLRNEMQSLGAKPEEKVGAGDKLLVYVVQPDTAEGQIILSVDRARGEQGWHTLQERFDSGEAFDGEVTGYNKGGLLVNVEGVNAFVPLSQVVGVRPTRDDGSSGLAEAVGTSLRLKVIEINRRRNRVILSERAAMQEWRSAQKDRLIQELREGDIRRGRISSVRSFGVFVDLGGADGLAHLSELSWDRDKSPAELYNVGDEVDVYVTKVDAENKKIALSLRRAKPEQWDAVVGKYQEGQVVTGLVTKLVTFGAFARIEGPVEGLIHVSELVDKRIGHPKDVVREGDLLPLKIVRIERDRHRLGLSLRRAREEGEVMGYVFSDGGEVLSVPESIRTEFVAREGPIPEPSEYPSYEETSESADGDAVVEAAAAAVQPDGEDTASAPTSQDAATAVPSAGADAAATDGDEEPAATPPAFMTEGATASEDETAEANAAAPTAEAEGITDTSVQHEAQANSDEGQPSPTSDDFPTPPSNGTEEQSISSEHQEGSGALASSGGEEEKPAI